MHALAKYCRKESRGFQFRNVNAKLIIQSFAKEECMRKLVQDGIEGYESQAEGLP